MTQSIRALLDKIADAKKQLEANREAEALRIAFDQVALVKLRIQTEGKNNEGVKYEPYTDIYKNRRKSKGFQVEFVDLTRSGSFFASIRPIVVSSNEFSATLEISPEGEDKAKQLKGLEYKRKNILQPSEEELAVVKAANRERILKYFRF